MEEIRNFINKEGYRIIDLNKEHQELEKNRKWITFEKARISFSQWEGSRNYPKKVEYEDYAIIKVEHKFKGYPFDIKRYEYEDMTPKIVNVRGIAYTSNHGKKMAYNYHVIETYPNRVPPGTKSEFDYIQKNVLPNKYQNIKKFNDIGKEKEKLLEQYIKEYQPIYEKEQLELQEKRKQEQLQAKKEWIKAETNFLKEEYSSNGLTKVFKLHGLHNHRVASSFNPSSSAIVNSITQDYLSDVYGFEKNQEIDYWQPLPKTYYYEEWCSDVTDTNDFILIKITAPTENEVDAYFDFNIKIGYEYGYNTDYENVEQLTIEEALPLIKNDEYKNMVINAREKSLDREDLEMKI